MSVSRLSILIIGILGVSSASVESSAGERRGYEILWWTLDGGGSTEGAAGGPYNLRTAVGQPVAGESQGGSYRLRTGLLAIWTYLTPGIREDDTGFIGPEFRLFQNRPNPFEGVTAIRFQVGGEKEIPVELRIYDASGRLVRTLVKGARRPGMHTVTWDGRDETGRRVSRGVYFCRFHGGAYVKTKKLIMIR